ncbi:MAG: hypothetical protein U1E76_20270 [Planctomycetota bacterium]
MLPGIFCCALALSLAGEIKPIETSFTDFAALHLEAGRLLPRPEAPDLVVGKTQRIDLAAQLAGLLRARHDELKQDWMKSLGNVLARLRDVKAEARATGELLQQLEQEAPSWWHELKAVLPELVRADRLYGKDWDPDDDEPDDGLLCAPPWVIMPSPARAVFWNGIRGDREVCQAAAMVYADLASLKQMELDYASYTKHVGNQYKQIHPVAGSYLVGKDPAGNEFSSMRVFFENHIPFPFPNVEAELTVYDHFTADGSLLSEVYSSSRDFHWLAGRDSLLPVSTLQGAFVGVLYVRELGFDVAGVPDGVSDRIKGIRSALGNKKRIAEQLFADAGAKGEWVPGKLPRPPVTGAK